MKNKTNYPTSLDQLDFDLSALIGKIKVVSSLCTSIDDFRFVKKILADLHETIDQHYDNFKLDEHNE